MAAHCPVAVAGRTSLLAALGRFLLGRPHIVATHDGTYAVYTLYSDRVVLVRLATALKIDEHTASRGIAELEEFVGPGAHAAVVDGRELGYLAPAGVEALHAAIGADRIATALIPGSKPGELFAGRFVERVGDTTASAIFDDVDEALAWAHDQVEGRRSGA